MSATAAERLRERDTPRLHKSARDAAEYQAEFRSISLPADLCKSPPMGPALQRHNPNRPEGPQFARMPFLVRAGQPAHRQLSARASACGVHRESRLQEPQLLRRLQARDDAPWRARGATMDGGEERPHSSRST